MTCWGGCDRLDVLAELRWRGLLMFAPLITSGPVLEHYNGKTQRGPREHSPFGTTRGQQPEASSRAIWEPRDFAGRMA